MHEKIETTATLNFEPTNDFVTVRIEKKAPNCWVDPPQIYINGFFRLNTKDGIDVRCPVALVTEKIADGWINTSGRGNCEALEALPGPVVDGEELSTTVLLSIKNQKITGEILRQFLVPWPSGDQEMRTHLIGLINEGFPWGSYPTYPNEN
jgi:hypothetical protein